MRTAIAPRELLPKGLYLQSLSIETGRVGIRVASGASGSRCPVCGLVSSRVHSRYVRTVSDLPWHGISVVLAVRARRFFCDEPSCERKIFCERLPEVATRARKTLRLEEALFPLGALALRRVMEVLKPDSSTNTRRLASERLASRRHNPPASSSRSEATGDFF
jgi:transposase